jgi:hypothetical protein
MTRFLAACTLVLAIATPAAAQSAGAYYRATLEKPAAPAHVISSEVVWYAHGNVLEAGIAGDTAKRVCAVLAQNVGTITEFSAEGKKLEVEDLAYCNKHARKK